MLSSIDALRLVCDLWEPIPEAVWLGRPPAPGALGPEALRHYQRFFIDKIIEAVDKELGLILALEPGAGKTGTVLTAVRRMLDQKKIRKVLIVAPLLVAKTVWPEEIYEWLETANTTHTLIRVEDDDEEVVAAGKAAYERALTYYKAQFKRECQALMDKGYTPGQASLEVTRQWHAQAMADRTIGEKESREAVRDTPKKKAEKHRQMAVAAAKERVLKRLLNTDTEIHIINKQALPFLWEHFGKELPYDLLVTDDLREGRSGRKRVLRSMKNDGTNAAAPLSRFGILAAMRKHVKATIQLTGTPTPKGLENMWGLTYLIDRGERLGSSKSKFLEEYFTYNKYNFSHEPRKDSFDRVMPKVKDIMYSLDPKDIGELPDYVINPIKVKLPPDVLREYKRLQKEFYTEVYDVEAVNGGALHQKSLQLANGSLYQEDGNDIPVHDCKLEALEDLVSRLNGTPLLVLYDFKFDVLRIKKAFPKAVVLTPDAASKIVKDWNADKIEILLAHRESAGHGLNMQKGTGHMCEYGLTTDVELFLQAKKRLHRSGRKTTVFNHVIIAEHTIDENVYPMYLDPRIETQNKILEAVRISFS